jgi:hypothetical protein
VRDVVAHVLSYDELGVGGLLGCAARGWFWSSRVNAVVLARYDSCGPGQLLGLLRAHLEPRGTDGGTRRQGGADRGGYPSSG